MADRNKLYLMTGIVFAGFLARSPITAIGPLLSMIGLEFGLNSTALGLLTTIPLIVFALGSVFVVNAASYVGIRRLLPLSFVLLALGICLRSFGGLPGLYLGTTVIALGLTVIMVLIPAVIKSSFPDNAGPVSGLFSGSISIFSTITAAASIPLAARTFLGWRGALLLGLILALPAFALWSRLPGAADFKPARRGASMLLHSRIAWYVSIFNGMHSLLFYSMVAWLPVILQSRGFTAEGAGYCASLYQLVGIPVSFIIPALAGRRKSQTSLAIVIGPLYLAAMTGLLLAPQPALIALSVAVLGLASVSCFSLGMVLFIFRTNGAEESAALSGMAQTVGYALAALGPICLGRIFDLSGSWAVPLGFLIIMTALLFCFLFASSRDVKITFPAHNPGHNNEAHLSKTH